MPELPEVETARRLVHTHLLGRQVLKIDVRLPKLHRDSPLPFPAPLLGMQLVNTRRRAKILVLDFDGSLSVLMHLKLAGQIAIISPDGSRFIAGHPIPKPEGVYPHKATHIDFHFDDGSILYLSDIRQFGWLRLMPTDDVDDVLAAFGFGPEGTQDLVSFVELAAKMQTRGIPIKTLLLDQTFIAGLGNIYVDEALFDAGIHPERPASSLTGPERKRLLIAVPVALGEGLKQGGATIINTRAFPIDGFPAVHGREGEPCVHCGTEIRKIRVGQRGTYFCPTCQKVRRNRIASAPSTRRSRSKIDIGVQ